MLKFLSKARGVALFLVIYQLLFLAALPFFLYFGTIYSSTLFVTILLYFLTGISITGGYHRLYAHKSYKIHPIAEGIVLFFGTLATQGSVLRWAFEHRIHHAFVDTDDDPYSIRKGFWYAHFLWLFDEPRPISPKVVSDLLENKSLQFQDRHYLPLVVGVNALVFFVAGFLLSDFIGAFFLVLWGRMFALHHSTWFINSLAHTLGNKPFSQEQSAVDNYILCFLTFGEGYHNYHHTFANDYRNGVKWYHFDPTKWTIWLLTKMGLASNLKRVDPAAIKKRMVIEHKRLLTDRLGALSWVNCDEFEKKIETISARLIDKINKWNEIRTKLSTPSLNDQELLNALKSELKMLKNSIRTDWESWKRLSKHILNLKPLEV